MENLSLETRVALFREMLCCGSALRLWCLDESGNLLETNCPHRDAFLSIIKFFNFQQTMTQYAAEHSAPLWLSTPLGISWMAVFFRPDEQLQRVYLIGPVSNTDISFRTVRAAILAIPKLAPDLNRQRELEAALQQVPVVASMVMDQLCLMLHYAVTSERLQISDIASHHTPIAVSGGKSGARDRHRTWIAEQNMLRMIREGDLNYKDALNQVRNLSSGVPLHTGDPIRQAKDSVIVSISLCVRAAIQGGLSPEIAYSVGDRYIQSVEEAKKPSDIGAINGTMFGDFVFRVHRSRSDPNVSQNIRRCCDYIETHTEEELSIALLADMVGYTDYYLSRKFKEEVHIGINDYIKIARIERAKFLLSDPSNSIHDIATRLHFCSSSHFGSIFHKIVGVSPREYRENYEASFH